MNFFGKIKQNLEHGEIKITMQAAESVSHKDPTLPVTINITNGAEVMHTINNVLAEIHATENNSGFGMALNNSVQLGNTTNNNEMYNMQTLTIAKSESAAAFVLQPNESKTITISVRLADVKDIKNLNHFKYELHVSVDVQGISLDPHVHQSLQIL